MNEARLLRLADKLDGSGPYKKKGPVTDKQFNIRYWVDEENPPEKFIALKAIKYHYDSGADAYTTAPYRAVKENLPCGYAACACGWAGADPWFRKKGLFSTIDNDMVLIDPENKETVLAKNDEAVKTFFELTGIELNYLFMETKYKEIAKKIKPKHVAERIRNFVAYKKVKAVLD